MGYWCKAPLTWPCQYWQTYVNNLVPRVLLYSSLRTEKEMIFKVKNPWKPPSSSNLSPREESETQADIEFFRSQKHVRRTCNFRIINLFETLNFIHFFTWWIIIPPTPDLFHVVCDIKVVITSQDSYASPSGKIIGFAVNNFGFLGILQKNADTNFQLSPMYTKLKGTRS